MEESKLRELARLGVDSLLDEVEAAFPGAVREWCEARFAHERAIRDAVQAVDAPARKRKRRMSAAARKAVSARMKRYWRERRAKGGR
jgi:hypothetical protein